MLCKNNPFELECGAAVNNNILHENVERTPWDSTSEKIASRQNNQEIVDEPMTTAVKERKSHVMKKKKKKEEKRKK